MLATEMMLRNKIDLTVLIHWSYLNPYSQVSRSRIESQRGGVRNQIISS